MRKWLQDKEIRAIESLDPDVAHYFTRGCGDDLVATEAPEAWRARRWRPRVLRDVSRIDTGVRLWGDWRMPLGVAPTAFHRLLHDGGEVATATGAAAAGVPFVLSSRATRRIEDVAAAIGGPWWFQVYLMHERSVTKALVQRAERHGATALVLTGDTPYVGYRASATGPRPLPITDDDALINIAEHLALDAGADPWPLIDQDPALSLTDIDWLREISDLPILVKGVLHPADAVACVDHGADGIWVSNHGGRQFDRAIATADALPSIVDAVDDDIPVVVDGGVRDGLDALTALALGARMAFVGRPVLWGLRTAGAAGVQQVLEEFAADIRHWAGCAGAARTADLDRSYLV
ncbi:alpha-hydroxy-acid oxidizing protein [Calidifontibacter sp. DB0510]|uniref:Alpha-hydroxy-acid oxidizing protein n=1 Tax=Metallococcus carri TaxID=1656884 RepID=A0A967EFR6_9MICO|nr:alpha-hydroxy acid oxidase [Metallococcus carri]NHN56881.1 alpha-hydroxy-acid oxidizing protein [Metallococcus carri]NOP37626.1 alpha-hydroxy-acid oxidizing protein [Calidifontibacter sp. DB2511S]